MGTSGGRGLLLSALHHPGIFFFQRAKARIIQAEKFSILILHYIIPKPMYIPDQSFQYSVPFIESEIHSDLA